MPKPVGESAADQQPQAGKAPDHADSCGSAIEDHFAEQGEEDLRRAAAGGPSHGKQGDGKHQRNRAHVAQAFAIFVPGTDTSSSVVHFALGAEAAIVGGAQVPDAPRGKNKGESIEDEGPFVADGDHGGAKEGADGEGDPLRGLGKRVGGMDFLLGSRWWAGWRSVPR